MKKSFWILIILAILIVIFSVQNANAVEFNFMSWTSEVSLAVLLIITFIGGVLIGAIYSALARRNKKNTNAVVKDVAFEAEESETESDS